MSRLMHFVGSVPSGDPEQAMRSMLRWAGSHIRSITDGETGDRNNWIIPIIDGFRERPDFVLARAGDFSSYVALPRFRVRRGHRLDPENLDFGHDEYALAALPAFRALRAELGRPDLSLQVGMAGDLNLALFTFGAAGAFRYRAAMREVLGREMRRIHAEGGDDVVFQIELPAELVFVAKTPGPLRPAVAAFLAGGVIRLVREAPVNARFGVHLCLGDLNHERLGRLTSTQPLVLFANALARRWPAERPLDYVHAPFTGGEHPVPVQADFYAPLARLRLPGGTRFIAGLVQETCGTADLRRALTLAEEAYGRPVDIAAPCGLGRRTPEKAEKNALLARELCEDSEPAERSRRTA